MNQVKGKGVVVQKLDPGQVLAKVGPFLASPGLKTLIDLLDIRIAVEQGIGAGGCPEGNSGRL